MEELIKEGLLWLAMIIPSASGIFAAVYLIIKGSKDLKEAVQTFTASQEVQKLAKQLEKLIENQSQERKTNDAEKEQLHQEIRLLVDQLRRVTGYADYKLGGGDNDGQV